MANDAMRAGPRGSSDQAPFVGPFIFEHVVSSAAIATTYVLTIPQRFGTNWRVRDIEAVTLTAISATSAAPVFKIGKTGDDDAFMTALTVANGTATSTTLSVAKANEASWATDDYLIDSDTDLLFTQSVAAAGSPGGIIAFRILLEPVGGTYFDNS
jgi:hypothetical protein